MIQVNSLKLTQGQFELNIPKLELEVGRIHTFVGPNGSGKSTLLKAISGEISQAKSNVIYNNECILKTSALELSKSRSVVHQEDNLYFPYTVQEVIEFANYGHKWKQKDFESICVHLMEVLDLIHFKNRIYPSLSGGEKQRVQIARALAQMGYGLDSSVKNRFLLLDEPLNHLDLKHQVSLLKILKKCSLSGIGVVLVMHDLKWCLEYSDICYVMQNGQIALTGKPQDVLFSIQASYIFGVDLSQYLVKKDATIQHQQSFFIQPSFSKGENMSTENQMDEKLAKAQELCQSFPVKLKSLQIASVSAQGQPHCSYAPFVYSTSGVFYVLLSGLAEHTPNLEANSKSAILLIEDESETAVVFARKRLSFDCTSTLVDLESEEYLEAKTLFISRFEKMAEHLLAMPDFRFFAIRPIEGRFVSGFGAAFVVDAHLNISRHLGGEGQGHSAHSRSQSHPHGIVHPHSKQVLSEQI